MADGIFFYSDALEGYNMGPQHPMQPIRMRRTNELLELYGVFETVQREKPKPCSLSDLRQVHSPAFIEAVHALSEGDNSASAWEFGFGFSDNPIFAGMYEAACLYTGASADAAQAVLDGSPIAMNISGGLHHAHYAKAAGFCIFNDCAVAANILRRKFDRVAYVDIDVHHGDGVQEAFYEDPTVLTISIHQSGRTLFPGTGFAPEIGFGAGEGFSVNVPMWPYSDDETWLWAWRESALPILKTFDPGAIVLQLGTDAHYLDPLAHIMLTAQGWLEAVKDVIALERPIVALGGGGYNQTTVPRMWTLAAAELFDLELPNETPEAFSFHDKIPTLRDRFAPEIPDREHIEARAQAEHTVDQLKRVLFPRFGLA